MFKGRFCGYETLPCECCTEPVNTEWENLTEKQVQDLIDSGFDFELGYTYNWPESLDELRESNTNYLEVYFQED